MKFQVKRKGLFSIGELATVFHVTPGTIRHYESLDLLKPSFVDPETNYRFYEFSRLEVLHTIRYLRSLGMTLEAIGEFLRDRNVSGILELLEAQKMEIAAKQRELKNHLITGLINRIRRNKCENNKKKVRKKNPEHQGRTQ